MSNSSDNSQVAMPTIVKPLSKYQEKRKQAAQNKLNGKVYDQAYCVKCRKNSKMIDPVHALTSNNRHMMKGKCECGRNIHVFVSKDYKHGGEAKVEIVVDNKKVSLTEAKPEPNAAVEKPKKPRKPRAKKVVDEAASNKSDA